MRRTKNDPSGKHPKTEEQYAAQYNTTARTIRAYKKQGAPLDDPEAMATFLAAKHHGPIDAEPADIASAKLQKLVLECKRLAHRNEVERGKYTANEDIAKDYATIGATQRAALEQLRGDAPALVGLDAATIDEWIAGKIEGICAILNDGRSYG